MPRGGVAYGTPPAGMEHGVTDTITEATAAESPQPPPPHRAARVMRVFGWIFIWFGLLSLGFVFHQIVITSWVASAEQGALEEERVAYFETAQVRSVFVDETGRPIVDAETGEVIPRDPRLPDSVAELPDGSSTTPDGSGGDPANPAPALPTGGEFPMMWEESPNRGQAFANIRIPSLSSLSEGWNVVEGVKLRQLRKGAGHMPWTPLPGQVGNSVISGHRTTNGAPFRDFDQLEPGDRIEVETAIGVHIYEVRLVRIVRPTALWVTADDGPKRAGIEGGGDGAWLTLTTCHPKLSARQRLIVFAQMVDGPNFDTIDRLTG